MVKAVLLALMLPVAAWAQKNYNPETQVRFGLLKADFTIAPGWDVHEGMTNIYLHGGLAYYLGRRISLESDGYYFIDTQGDGRLMHNHNVFFGMAYHRPFKRFDPFIGLQPGISLIQMRRDNANLIDSWVTQSTLKPAPAISATIGFNLYIWKYVHFLTSLRYVHAEHPVEWGQNLPLDEFRISFGLCWNVNTVRNKE